VRVQVAQLWWVWFQRTGRLGVAPCIIFEQTGRDTRALEWAGSHGCPPAVGRWCLVVEGDVDGGLLVGVSRPMLRTPAIQPRAPRSACIAPEPSLGALR
jgi:hypothetical protein